MSRCRTTSSARAVSTNVLLGLPGASGDVVVPRQQERTDHWIGNPLVDLFVMRGNHEPANICLG